MASLCEKLENEVEIKSSADKFFHMFGKEAHKVPNMFPASIQAVYMHEGDWESQVSVKELHFTVDGKQEVFKKRMTLDETNKLITSVGLEGHPMEMYKSFKTIFHPVPKQDGNGSMVKLTIEYEKSKADVPPPNHYMNLWVNMIKDMDAHIVEA